MTLRKGLKLSELLLKEAISTENFVTRVGMWLVYFHNSFDITSLIIYGNLLRESFQTLYVVFEKIN